MTDSTAFLAEHEKEQHELHAREGALAQRQADQAKAAVAEEERLVGKAREVDLGRGELREAEVALQAQRAQAQQGEPGTASLQLACEMVRILDVASSIAH